MYIGIVFVILVMCKNIKFKPLHDAFVNITEKMKTSLLI